MSEYSHRNGETEPPTIEGRYWLDGEFGDIPYRGMVTFLTKAYKDHPLIYREGYDGWSHPDELRGQWWGPIMPPWT